MPIAHRPRLPALLLACTLLLGLHPSARGQTFTEALDRLLQRNPELLSLDAGVSAGRESVAVAQSALKSSMSLNAQTQWIEGRIESTSGSGDRRGYHDTEAALEWRRPLLRPVQTQQVVGAQARLRQAEQDREAGLQQLLLRLSQAYADLASAQAEVAYYRSVFAAASGQQAEAQARFDAGSATLIDVAEARARRDAAEAGLLGAQATLEARAAELARLTGQPLAQAPPELRLVDFEVPEALEPEAVWLARAQAAAPALAARAEAVRSAQAALAAADAATRPTIDAVASLGLSRASSNLSSVSSRAGSTVKQGAAGLVLNVPLDASGGLAASQRQALAQLAQAEAALEAESLAVAQSLRSALARLRTADTRQRALGRAVDSAELSLRASRLAVQVGLRVTLDVLNAQQALASAQRDRINGLATLWLARVSLLQAVGGLGPDQARALATQAGL